MDFLKPQTYGGVRISEADAGRVQRFELQYQAGNEWKTIFSGTMLGENFRQKFEPVTAEKFRLNILEATQGPSISEIQLLPK